MHDSDGKMLILTIVNHIQQQRNSFQNDADQRKTVYILHIVYIDCINDFPVLSTAEQYDVILFKEGFYEYFQRFISSLKGRVFSLKVFINIIIAKNMTAALGT